jgi:hypothetical protein
VWGLSSLWHRSGRDLFCQEKETRGRSVPR